MTRPVAKTKVVKMGSTGEWIVRAYTEDGTRLPDCDYFTNSEEDARATAKLMINFYVRKEIPHGNTSNEQGAS